MSDPQTGNVLQPPLGVYRRWKTALRPEKTDSYTAGLVYSPSYVRGLTLTADYYQLFTTGLIIDPASFAQVFVTKTWLILTASVKVVRPRTWWPGAGYDRDATGQISRLTPRQAMPVGATCKGLDLTAIYQIQTANLGTFTVSGGLNHFFTYKIEPQPGSGYANFLGNFTSSLPLTPGAVPFNKAFLRTEWEWKGFDFVATENYIGDYEDDPTFLLAEFR